MRRPFYEHKGQIAIKLPGARAIFTTVSWGDARNTQAKISERLGVELTRARQVHGRAVVVAHAAPRGGLLGTEADAVVTTVAGVAPTVISADCVPVVIAGAGAVAAVHAGWKGLRDGIIRRAVGSIRINTAEAGYDAPLSAAIGPCARGCCYEVGDDLHELFAERGEDFREGRNLDLGAIARRQLTEAGVETIHDCGICTVCSDPSYLYSYRRDGEQTGRQAASVWLS